MMIGKHGAFGDGGHLDDEAHRHRRGAALGERNVASGTIASISGTTFVLTTAEGALTVTTSTDYHSARMTEDAGYEDLAFDALTVGLRVAVQGERQDDSTLSATRVHIPKP